jgi:hypothetical protein
LAADLTVLAAPVAVLAATFCRAFGRFYGGLRRTIRRLHNSLGSLRHCRTVGLAFAAGFLTVAVLAGAFALRRLPVFGGRRLGLGGCLCRSRLFRCRRFAGAAAVFAGVFVFAATAFAGAFAASLAVTFVAVDFFTLAAAFAGAAAFSLLVYSIYPQACSPLTPCNPPLRETGNGLQEYPMSGPCCSAHADGNTNHITKSAFRLARRTRSIFGMSLVSIHLRGIVRTPMFAPACD